MKALTLTQPWATLVVLGIKQVETRGWSTPYRGPLAIHAAKGQRRWAKDFEVDLLLRGILPAGVEIPLGAVLGTVRLVDCVATEALQGHDPMASGFVSALEDDLGDFSPRRFGWFLADPVPLDSPVPARGSLGLWDWQRAA